MRDIPSIRPLTLGTRQSVWARLRAWGAAWWRRNIYDPDWTEPDPLDAFTAYNAHRVRCWVCHGPHRCREAERLARLAVEEMVRKELAR